MGIAVQVQTAAIYKEHSVVGYTAKKVDTHNLQKQSRKKAIWSMDQSKLDFKPGPGMSFGCAICGTIPSATSQ